MKVKIREIVGAQSAQAGQPSPLGRILNAPVSKAKTAYRIVRLKREVLGVLDDYNQARSDAIERHGATPVDPSGKPVEDRRVASRYMFWQRDQDGDLVQGQDGNYVEDKAAAEAFAAEIDDLLDAVEEITRYLNEHDHGEINDALDRPLTANEIDATAWLWEGLRELYEVE